MDGAPPEQTDAAPAHAAARRPRVLFISADPVDERMAGLGIRCWELARALSSRASVTVAHGGSDERQVDGVRTVAFRPHAPRALRALIASSDAVVTHPQWPLVNRWLRRSSARVVIDLYCPETLETLELLTGRAVFSRRQLTATTVDRLHASLRTGHNFMCASETQRDLWLGAMLALRLIDPELYDRDPSLRRVIDLVPFGVPQEPPPAAAGEGPRDTIAALGANTAIRAVAAVATRRPDVRLLFMAGGEDHPAAARSTESARELARELGLLGSVVHFHAGWVPYARRAAWLTQADSAISAHADHLESRFAYRTRVLDCFWAGLPVVCTSGDALAEQITREGLGAVAPPGDVNALAAALERVLERGRDSYAPSLRDAAERQTWARVVEPLARWISEPTPSGRPGDGPEVLGPSPAQRLREAAYLAGGRVLMARR